LFPFSVAEYVIISKTQKKLPKIIHLQYFTTKSEKFLRTSVIAGISVTDPLNVSKIPGKTNQNK
jgi:hypothetical protein